MKLPNYFFLRPKLATAERLAQTDQFIPLGKTIDQLFRIYLEGNKYKIQVPDDNDVRIVI